MTQGIDFNILSAVSRRRIKFVFVWFYKRLRFIYKFYRFPDCNKKKYISFLNDRWKWFLISKNFQNGLLKNIFIAKLQTNLSGQNKIKLTKAKKIIQLLLYQIDLFKAWSSSLKLNRICWHSFIIIYFLFL